VLKDQLVGTLRLVSREAWRSDGETIQPMGPNPAGMFMFDRDGNVSVQLTNPDEPPASSDEPAARGRYGGCGEPTRSTRESSASSSSLMAASNPI
jgi:Lipocalin-like domain